MSHPNSIDDSDWPEVRFINGYAMLIGFLRMGVRGLSVLVFTWATVVLLGGFVSDLEKTEFWCLTMITLIQTFGAGVFDFLFKGNSSNSRKSWKALLAAASTMVKDMPISRKKRQLGLGSKRRKMVLGGTTIINFFLWVLQLLVLATVLFPLVVVYLAGLYISTGISLWRLIRHYNDNANGASNQKPALVVLYTLAAAQGALHSFKALYAWVKGVGLVEEVADSYSMDKDIVSGYLSETMIGCAKDPTFSRRRNLVTYAVDLLMESKSTDSYLSGIQILGTVLELPLWDFTQSGQPDLIKKLLTKSASCGHMIQRLIETMGTESPDSREIREHAARIVAHVADAISLRYFPGGIKFLSFLLNTVEDYYERKLQFSRARRPHIKYLRSLRLERHELAPVDQTSGSNWLVVQGLRIIKNLATDEDNCRIIIKTAGLMSKMTAPLISDKLHRDHHDEWSSIADASLELMVRLMAAPGQTRANWRRKILRKHKGIINRTLHGIIECGECEVLVKRQAVGFFLLILSEETSPQKFMASGSSRSSNTFIWILLLVFLGKKGSEDIVIRLAGENLWAMLPLEIEGSDARMLQSVRVVVGDLTRALVDVDAANISTRLEAAKILKCLCDHTMDDEYLKEVKKALVVVMPVVLRDIFGYVSTREEATQAVVEANNVQSSLQNIDLESGDVSHGNAQENTSSSNQHIRQHPEGRKLQETLISLCRRIWWEWYDEDDPDLTCQLDEIAAKICEEQGKRLKSFPRLVFEAENVFEKEAEESACRN